MPDYRPSTPGPLILPCGTWSAPGLPDRLVTISIDPRLLTWWVSKAARRSDRTYKINTGTPPAQISLT
jgi:hypothetical protein